MPGRDRLSLLPDDVLHHILSFLGTTQLRAQTSLLSRRFRHLWTHHPSLHLSFPFSSDPDHDRSADAPRYIRTVDLCLRSFRPPVLHSLALDLWFPISDSPADSRAATRTADRWIHFAADHQIRELTLRASSKESSLRCRIPPSLFSCHKSLTHLDVSLSTFPAVPPNFRGFRSLKKLRLCFELISPDGLRDLLAACPALESLELAGCFGPASVEISARNLPNLVHLLLFAGQEEWEWWIGARVEAPNLKSFWFHGDLTDLAWKGSLVLDQATLRHRNGKPFGTLDDWMKIVVAVSTVKVLTVNHWFHQFEIPKDYLRGGPVFKNLKELNFELDWVTGTVIRVLTSNLGECPLLEELYISFNRHARSDIRDSVQAAHGKEPNARADIMTQQDIVRQVEDDHEQDGCNPSDHLKHMKYSFQHLKTVVLKDFLGSKNEMRLSEFLLGRAVVLEKFMAFDFFWRDEDVLQKLFAPVARASSQVQMKFTIFGNSKLDTYFLKSF